MGGDGFRVAGGRWRWLGSRSERLGTEPARSRTVPRCGAVDASTHPHGSALFALVAHGVAEHSDRVLGDEGESVVMEERVKVAQRELAVAVQDGDADRPQGAPEEPDRFFDHGRERILVEVWRASALLPGDDGPQVVAGLAQLADELAPLRGEMVELVVDRADGGESLLAGDLQLQPGATIETAGHPDEQVLLAEQPVELVSGRLGHGGYSRGPEISRTPSARLSRPPHPPNPL
ncbi:MAG: hypothetical protein U5K29_11630 [Acidimicrobiales bacterium]|nr:hypothetical protein [Acidimicrobiales bacterium]